METNSMIKQSINISKSNALLYWSSALLQIIVWVFMLHYPKLFVWFNILVIVLTKVFWTKITYIKIENLKTISFCEYIKYQFINDVLLLIKNMKYKVLYLLFNFGVVYLAMRMIAILAELYPIIFCVLTGLFGTIAYGRWRGDFAMIPFIILNTTDESIDKNNIELRKAQKKILYSITYAFSLFFGARCALYFVNHFKILDKSGVILVLIIIEVLEAFFIPIYQNGLCIYFISNKK